MTGNKWHSKDMGVEHRYVIASDILPSFRPLRDSVTIFYMGLKKSPVN